MLSSARRGRGSVARPQAVLAAVGGVDGPTVERLAATSPARRRPRSPIGPRSQRGGAGAGAGRRRGWLDDYVERWRDVRLAISGDDLLAAGVPEGPRVGRGLARRCARSSTARRAAATPSFGSRSRPLGRLNSLRACNGTSKTASAGSRRSCPERGPRSRPALGGASTGAFESLNLGLYTDDAEAAVRTNRARLAAALGATADGVLFGFQVHGAEIERRERAAGPNPYRRPAGTGRPSATAR